jgi:hypoxanthine phosphoribosyltransferase
VPLALTAVVPISDTDSGWRAMTPRRTTVEHSRGVFNVEWPLFGELSRALALKVSREYDPQVVVGIATAGVIPGAVIAAILDREFHSIVVSRRYGTEAPRMAPAVLSPAPAAVYGKRVLIVDETCDSGETMRLAVNALSDAGAREVRTAVGFKTGSYEPDFHSIATESTIVLPWDREILIDGELVTNPLYADVLK